MPPARTSGIPIVGACLDNQSTGKQISTETREKGQPHTKITTFSGGLKDFFAFVRRERARILTKFSPVAFCLSIAEHSDTGLVLQQTLRLMEGLAGDSRDYAMPALMRSLSVTKSARRCRLTSLRPRSFVPLCRRLRRLSSI
jgi:hypothetical protein